MSDYNEQGVKYFHSGEQKLKKRMFKAPDIDGAIEDFEKAGNYFKMAKNYSRAGEAYTSAADLYLSSGKPQLAINHLNSAINVYNMVDEAKASSLVQKLIDSAMSAGRFLQAGKVTRELAEKLEEKGDDASMRRALELYKKAGDIFACENSAESELRNCRIKIAEISALTLKEYKEAAHLFEVVGTDCVKIKLLQFHAKGHFLRAFMCIATFNDAISCEEIYNKYLAIDPSLEDSPESDYMADVIAALKEDSYDMFVEANSRLSSRVGAAVRGNTFLRDMMVRVGDMLEKGDAVEEGADDDLM